jgi:hypothetical protein
MPITGMFVGPFVHWPTSDGAPAWAARARRRLTRALATSRSRDRTRRRSTGGSDRSHLRCLAAAACALMASRRSSACSEACSDPSVRRSARSSFFSCVALRWATGPWAVAMLDWPNAPSARAAATPSRILPSLFNIRSIVRGRSYAALSVRPSQHCNTLNAEMERYPIRLATGFRRDDPRGGGVRRLPEGRLMRGSRLRAS